MYFCASIESPDFPKSMPSLVPLSMCSSVMTESVSQSSCNLRHDLSKSKKKPEKYYVFSAEKTFNFLIAGRYMIRKLLLTNKCSNEIQMTLSNFRIQKSSPLNLPAICCASTGDSNFLRILSVHAFISVFLTTESSSNML